MASALAQGGPKAVRVRYIYRSLTTSKPWISLAALPSVDRRATEDHSARVGPVAYRAEKERSEGR